MPPTADELDALAARLTLADFVRLARRVVLAAYPELTCLTLVGEGNAERTPLLIPIHQAATPAPPAAG